MYIGFGLEAKNVDLAARDEVRHTLPTRRTRAIKFRGLEKAVLVSVVKVRGCGAKDLEGKEKAF